MVQIWEMDPYIHGDRRLPHHCFPPRRLVPDELHRMTGVQVFKLNTKDLVSMSTRIATLKIERSYTREDILILDGLTTANFVDKLEELYTELTPPEELARFVLEGESYYDIKREEGKWLRLFVETGDLLIIPSNCIHRFTTTPKNYVKIKRFYKDNEKKV